MKIVIQWNRERVTKQWIKTHHIHILEIVFTVFLTKFPIVKFAKWELKKKENWNTVQQFKNCTCIKKMSTFSASFKSDHIRILFWFILWKETYDV